MKEIYHVNPDKKKLPIKHVIALTLTEIECPVVFIQRTYGTVHDKKKATMCAS